MTKKKWTRWLIPGFIFQSVTIGGGYGTGAEIAQYFGASGMVGGLLSALVTRIRSCLQDLRLRLHDETAPGPSGIPV